MADPEAPLTIVVSDAQLALLKKHDFPCSEAVLASARETEEGIELSGSEAKFDSLAGWVAGEANYAQRNRRSRQAALLYDIAEQLESALHSRRAFRVR